MSEENDNNKKPFERTMEIETPGEWQDSGEKTREFAPVRGDASPETSEETRQFVMENGGKKPLERCEERGAVKNYTALSVAWRVLRPFLIFVVSAALVWFLGSYLYRYVEGEYFSPVSEQTEEMVDIEIKTGSSLSTISTKLFEAGIIRNKFVFQMYVDFNDMGSKLLAGEYQLSPSMTMDEIIAILGKGDGGRQVVQVTFTEGMTIEDIAEKLVSAEIFDTAQKAQFLLLCNDADTFEDYEFVTQISAMDNADERRYLLEGYLFPDTYEFYADETPENIIRRLLDRFDSIFTLSYEDRAQELGMSIDSVMTLASIIEWESRPKDFKKVSAVFYNRLAEEWTFDSCATMRYVTGEKKFVYTASELEIDSPYNTYMYPGLPIGPVANPGQKAIEAALYPDEEYLSETYLFFCTADPETGELAFAQTLEQHNENVAMYEDLWE